MHRVAIHSAPRSGSTWLGEIFNSSPYVKYCFQPLFSYRFKDFLNESSTGTRIANFFEELTQTEDEFICQKSQRNRGSLPKFAKCNRFTHTVYKEVRYHHLLRHICQNDNETRLILLIRDPVEVMNSWINAPREFDPSWNAAEELFCAAKKNAGKPENFYGLNAWISSAKLFEQLADDYSARVKLVEYRALREEPIRMVNDLFSFCELDVTEATEQFLSESVTRTVDGTYSVFRGGEKSPVRLDSSLVEQIRSRVSESGLAHYLDSNG